MSNVFFSADLHLGHDKIRDYCSRPFASKEIKQLETKTKSMCLVILHLEAQSKLSLM